MAADDYFPPDSNTSAKGAWVEAEQVSIEAAALEGRHVALPVPQQHVTW